MKRRFPPIFSLHSRYGIIKRQMRRKGIQIMDESLIYEVLSVVEEIPEGRVATYGQIAGLIGREKNARLVGKILSMSQYYGRYPCQ